MGWQWTWQGEVKGWVLRVKGRGQQGGWGCGGLMDVLPGLGREGREQRKPQQALSASFTRYQMGEARRAVREVINLGLQQEGSWRGAGRSRGDTG